jgi:hypothetical protein
MYCIWIIQSSETFRFPAPRHPRDIAKLKVMQDIERHANDAWGSGKRCTAAYDFLRVNVPIEFSNGPSSSYDPVENSERHERQPVGTVTEPESDSGEGRKRRRSLGNIDNPAAEDHETRNSESARGGRGGWSHVRSGYPNMRRRGFYGNRGRGRAF